MEQGYLTQPLEFKHQPPAWFWQPRSERADTVRFSDTIHSGVSDRVVGFAERKSMTESSIPFVRNFTFFRITERLEGCNAYYGVPDASPYISLTGKKTLFLNVLTKTYLRKGKERHRRESVVHVFG